MEAARIGSGLTVQQLWLRYVALGGTSDAFDIDGYLQGLLPLDTFQQDVLAQTVNEALEEFSRSLRVPLSAPSDDGAVDSALYAVIDRLLAVRPNATRLSAPDAEVTPPRGEDQPPASPPRSPPKAS
ncbi:hypothetical protein [Modestobacter excelsi]|uniref:hypothetical protein n=1 Tax=Modestobacter excelsi TaxID=2213161 RepID=UPI00110CD6D9|nr:hypothetical protein [Modestobacter excelsi]